MKGGKGGVAADADGNFRIQAKTGDVLVMSATGAISKEVPVGSESVLNASLTKTNEELTSVVVTALGVKKQSRETGFSTAVVGTKELNQAKVTNIATGLTAKVSGLQINTVNNGVDPATRITLRGNRSILGNNQALLVLDGVPVSIGYLNSVNPNDVDNVTVLKGATASASTVLTLLMALLSLPPRKVVNVLLLKCLTPPLLNPFHTCPNFKRVSVAMVVSNTMLKAAW